AAYDGAGADLRVPHRLHGRPVDRPVGTRLLALADQAAAADLDEVGRRAEVEVEAGRVRAEHVAARGLKPGADRAGGEVELEDGVGGRSGVTGVRVAGADVDGPVAEVDPGRGPHRAAVEPRWHRVRLPDHPSADGVEGDDAAPQRG